MSRNIGGHRYDVRVDCAGCGFHLGYLAQSPSGLVNVDPRSKPKGGSRLVHDAEHGNWSATCRCGATPRLRDENVEKAVAAVMAAGLHRMPFKAVAR